MICSRFEATPDQAIASINKTWRHMDFRGEGHIYYHESPGYWANTHWLGKDSQWWLPKHERDEFQEESVEPKNRLGDTDRR